jgi:hypothetical protein
MPPASLSAESSRHVVASKELLMEFCQVTLIKKLEAEISTWPNISVHPHRFGGVEFRFGSAEVGHLHTAGMVDIPFPRAVHDALLADGLAEEHRWVPNSGWTTFRVRNEADIEHALWLMRLSYLRYKLKVDADPRGLLGRESHDLHLTPSFASLLEKFVPSAENAVADESFSAAQ